MIPQDGSRLNFAFASSASQQGHVQVQLLTDPSFSTTVALSGVGYTIPANRAFSMSCDVSTYAGQVVKVRFVALSSRVTRVMNGGTMSSLYDFLHGDWTKDPISFTSGALTYEHTDIAIPGRGVPLEFTRHYYSGRNTLKTDLGYGWTHNYSTSLTLLTDGSATVNYPNGAGPFFAKSGGTFTAPDGVYDTLVQNGGGDFTLTMTDQTELNFDSGGRLTSQVDRNGNTTTITYDSDGIDYVTDPGGRVLQFTVNSTTKNITTVSDGLSPDNRVFTFAYDGNGDLQTVTYRTVTTSTATTTYGYASTSHLLATVTNGLTNLQVTNEYDTADRVRKQTDAAGGVTCMYYGTGPANSATGCTSGAPSPSAGQTIMRDPRGNEELHEFDTSFRPTLIHRVANSVNIDTAYTYDADNNLESVTDPLANVTSYTYDADGNVEEVFNALRQPVSAPETGGDCGGPGTGDGVDDDSDTVIDDGCPSTVVTYTGLNDVDIVTDARGNSTDYDYDGDGNLIQITDALSNDTDFDWETGSGDSCSGGGSPADRSMLCIITDANGNDTLFTYDEYGNILTVEDAEGNVTGYTYDLGGRVLTVTKPSRAANSTPESGADCGSDGTGDGVDDDSDTSVDDGCPSSIFEYDQQNNLTQATDAYVTGGPPITDFIYDVVGNQTGMRNANRLASGSPESGSNCDNTTGTGNGVDNDTDSVVDDGCLSVAYTYDVKNRLTNVIQARIAGAGSTRKTTYTYDANDNLDSVTDPLHQGTGRETNYTYDEVNQLELIAHPDVHYTTAYTYDANGNRLTMTDTRGACETGYTSSCSLNTTENDTTTYVYDDLNRLASVQTTFDGTSRTVSYTHDAANNRTSITYPDSKVASYSYDALNRLEQVTASWFAGTTDYDYDAAGRLILTTLPSSTDLETTYDYDDANRLVGITDTDTTGPTDIAAFDYVLDANGNRTQLTDSEGVSTFAYDELERLTSATYPSASAITYTYDKVGNRLSVSSPSTSYTYDAVDQLSAIGGTGNTHDADGNLQKIDTGATPNGNTFLWDLDNQLFRTGPCRGDLNADATVNPADSGIRAARNNKAEGTNDYDLLVDLNHDLTINNADAGILAADQTLGWSCKNTGANTGNARHWYNGDGLRTRQRTFPASPTYVDNDYVWDQGAGLPVVLQDVRTPSTGSPSTTTYLYGIGLIAETNASGDSFYLADGLGSTRVIAESDGDIANTYTYDVWGAIRASTGSVPNQFEFAGEQADHNANRGLTYLRARHYDPALGRFLSRDTLNVGNFYSYVYNNPTNLIDPSGHDALEGGMNTPVPTATNTPTPTPTATSVCYPPRPGYWKWDETCGGPDRCESSVYMPNRSQRCAQHPLDCSYNSVQPCGPTYHGNSGLDLGRLINLAIAKLQEQAKRALCKRAGYTPCLTPGPLY